MPEQPTFKMDEATLRSRLRSTPTAQPVRHVNSEIRFAPRRRINAPDISQQTVQPKFVSEFITANRVQRSQALATDVRQQAAPRQTKPVFNEMLSPGVRHLKPVPTIPRPNRSTVLKRQAAPVSKPISATPVKITKPKQARSRSQLLMTGMALFIFMVGLWVSFATLRTNHSVKSEVSALGLKNATESSDGTITGDQTPDETPPKGNLRDYRVAADLPRFISIPSLEVNSRVLRLGVSATNELKTPANIYDSGWYDGSSKPGEAGAVLIDGHINGASKPGVFFGLKKLVAGDIIDIEKGDGTKLSYRVVKSQSYPADQVDMSAALTPVIAGKKGLNLITCDGKPIKGKTYSYDHRLVVFAVQVD